MPWAESCGLQASLVQDTTPKAMLSLFVKGNGNPLQCSCLENPRDRGARWAAIYGVAESRTRLN